MERELDDELRFHLDMQFEDNLRLGMSAEEAACDAVRRLGGIESMKEEHRETRSFATIESLFRDIHYAARTLRGNPGFTAVAIMTLALGIGVNAIVFTVTKAALFAGFPMVERNDRILYLSSGRGCCLSYPDFEDWRAQAKSFEGMAVVHGTRGITTDKGGFTVNYDVTEVSADTFRLIGARPMLGHDFTRSDEIPGAAPVAILTYSFWDSRFAKDPKIVGRTIRMNGIPTTVIGIMPQGFSFPEKQDVWVPLIPTPEVRDRGHRDPWFAFGRLAPGATVAGARAEMEAIGRRLGDAFPLTNRGRNLIPQVQTFNQFFFFGNENTIYWTMWGAVVFVLLIACANLANLMLARAIGRSRELSLRIALGASRWRVVRQLLFESLMLSLVGGLLGWGMARQGVQLWAVADRGPGMQSWRILDYSLDYRVLAYLIAISAGAALLFGLAPARRVSKLDVNAALKDGGRGASGNVRGRHLSGLLVIGEMALAVLLLTGAGVMVRSFLNIYHANLGVNTANILIQGVSLPPGSYPLPEARTAFFDKVSARLKAVPGVESLALTDALPTRHASSLPYELAGSASAGGLGLPTVSVLVVSPDYFRTLGAILLSGRDFTDQDNASGLPVAIVNERFASRAWPDGNPLGSRFRVFDGKNPAYPGQAWLTVVGVSSDIVQNDGTGQKFSPAVYLPYRQKSPRSLSVLARTRVPPENLAIAFRREMLSIDSELPVFRTVTLNEQLQGNYWSTGLYGVLFAILAAIGLLLASVGLYAVMAHSVSRRTQEIGIRMAIGATARDVRRLVFRQGMLPLGIGLAIGLAGSFAVNPVLKSFLVQVSPSDPMSLGLSALILIVAALLGCLIPAHRTTLGGTRATIHPRTLAPIDAASAPFVAIAATAPSHTYTGARNVAASVAAVTCPTSPHSEKKIAANDTIAARA
jgi:predicted permease